MRCFVLIVYIGTKVSDCGGKLPEDTCKYQRNVNNCISCQKMSCANAIEMV